MLIGKDQSFTKGYPDAGTKMIVLATNRSVFRELDKISFTHLRQLIKNNSIISKQYGTPKKCWHYPAWIT
jgi:hypothetical protein